MSQMIELAFAGFDELKTGIAEALTPKPDMSRAEIEERAKDRKDAQNAINFIMKDYQGINDPNWDSEAWVDSEGNTRSGIKEREKLLSMKNILDNELKITYDELKKDSNFLRNAQMMYKAEHGHDYTGLPKDLVEETFKKFNFMEFNVGWTGAELVSDSMFYDDFNKEQLTAVRNAYTQFQQTPWTGDGSRAFSRQLRDLVVGTAADPLSWAFFSQKAIQAGSTLGKLGAKKLFQKKISDRIAASLGAASYTGMYSGAQNTNIQNIEIDLGMKDEFSKVELGLSTVVGAALPPAIALFGLGGKYVSDKVGEKLANNTSIQNFQIPILSKNMASLVGNITRAGRHPQLAYYGKNMVDDSRGTLKGKTSAMLGVMSDLRDNMIGRSSKNAVREFQQGLNDHVVNPMNQAVKNGYEALVYRDMTDLDSKGMMDAIQKIIDGQKNNADWDKAFTNNRQIQDLLDLLNPKVSDDAMAKWKQSASDISLKNSQNMAEYRRLVQEYADNMAKPIVLQKNLQNPIKPEKLEIPPKPKPEHLQAKTTNTEGLEVPSKDISETFKSLRSVLYEGQQNALAGDTKQFATLKALKEIREIVSKSQRNQLSTKGDKQLYDSLLKSTEDFKTVLEKTTIGKKFAAILQNQKDAVYNKTKRNAAGQFDGNQELAKALDQDTDMMVQALLEDIIDTKNSFPLLQQFESTLKSIDYRTNRVVDALNQKNNVPILEKRMMAQLIDGNFDEFPELAEISKLQGKQRDQAVSSLASEKLKSNVNSYEPIREIIKSRFGQNLIEDMGSDDARSSGLVMLAKVLDREDGFEFMKHLYPEFNDSLSKIQSLDDFLKNKVKKKHSQSVIVNMTFANLAMEAGMVAGGGGGLGKILAGGSTLATMGGLQVWRNLVGDPQFQKAMADILNNDGRIPTKTAAKLQDKFGFDQGGIQQLQDDLNNMLITIPVIKTQEELRGRDDMKAQKMLMK